MGIENLFDFLQDAGNYESRKIGRTDVNGLTVSTCYTSDEGYETAILDANGAHPVERYETRKLAEEGHQKWCEAAKNITVITKLGWQGLIGEKEIQLERTTSD